jgi:two-component system cell cycle response regulator
MTALILVVDDIPSNVKILEIKLTAKYYEVITASNGMTAIELAQEKQPDIVLLDVMMPEMDGFETCRRLKQNYATMHIPVIIVTALTDIDNKIEGLNSGADEFLIKPVKDFALFTRIKSLLRFKNIFDELRLRLSTQLKINIITENEILKYVDDFQSAKIVVVDNEKSQFQQIKEILSPYFSNIIHLSNVHEQFGNIDLAIINISITKELLRFCSILKSKPQTRLVPVITIIDDEDDQELINEITDVGINDYITLPLNENELLARVRTHAKRKKYQDAIEENVENNLKMAVIDPLTSLYNRYYFEKYMNELIEKKNKSDSKKFSLAILDIDFFKKINDTYGHLSGDLILKQIASILKANLRLNDLIVRFGGEEIVIIFVDIQLSDAQVIAERLREIIANYHFQAIDNSIIRVTVSIGVSEFEKTDTLESLIKKSDKNLYLAKEQGRNRVVY